VTRPVPAAPQETVAALRTRMEAAAQARLGRSLAVRHLDAGDCGGCALELAALRDLPRHGLSLVESPRHADVLLVTGPVTRNMAEALVQAHAAMAAPAWVVALGDCAVDGGVFRENYAVHGGVEKLVPVDLTIRGCPPAPAAILAGLLALLEANAPPRAARVTRRR
jgi:Ni,Fe-hydrogenase III small subunit